MKAIKIFVGIEVAIFLFTAIVSMYNLSLDGPLGKEYRSMQQFHLVVTFILIYLAVDHRRLAKGYMVVFLIVWVLDVIQALECTLYLSRSNKLAFALDLASSWANVGSISAISVWYCYVVVKNGKKLQYVHY